MTMAFLPGTSFAVSFSCIEVKTHANVDDLNNMQALLSMPFFGDDTSLSSPSKFWIWVVLTLPATAAAFGFYWQVTTRRGLERGAGLNQSGSRTASGQEIPLSAV